MVALSTQLSNSATHANVLNDLRVVERKMGLVLTLFKASVWAIVMQQSDAQDDAEWDELEEQYDALAIPEETTIDEAERTDAGRAHHGSWH